MKLPSLYALSAGILLNCWHLTATAQQSEQPQLPQLLSQAMTQDYALTQSRHSEQALNAQRDAVQPLPDPRVSVGMVNVPVDGFALDEQAMTQLKVGVSQMLPRGDSVDLARNVLAARATEHPARRALREAEVTRAITLAWISVIVLHNSADLVNEQLHLLDQLTTAIANNYASSSGASQYDVLGMEVLHAALEDRLEAITAQQQSAVASLGNWLTPAQQSGLTDLQPNQADQRWLTAQLEQSLPAPDQASLLARLQQHPLVLIQNSAIDVKKINQQQVAASFDPQWEFNASYAYRQDDTANRSRADFVSVGMSVDIPLFSGQVKQAALAATVAETESMETEKRLIIQQQLSQVKQLYARYPTLASRLKRYHDTLLPLRLQHYEAALNAYTTASGNFSDVMQSNLALIDDQMKLLALQGDMASLITQLAFYLQPASHHTGNAL
ncbi:TolC family protein [Alteromonas lipolytica]|uniref:Transporter n=1 Tax=Alteromonas lipolytica TaxID=1856405 RepID=A0A1E8FA41_9ALTE|nr:TolC family protein [Alteromonas lipolytica]OFI32646.1 hypothetical protein BFC17_05700 [Alteromonas lipolytica]GGF74403.1 copper transporter [Alteromonas lipolytica]